MKKTFEIKGVDLTSLYGVGDKNIIFLNPAETENGFYIETGWTSIGNKIKIPTKESVWSVKGNDILSSGSPVVLQWNNGEGVVFQKKIELDEKYLFKISQQVKNNSNSLIELYPYAQTNQGGHAAMRDRWRKINLDIVVLVVHFYIF